MTDLGGNSGSRPTGQAPSGLDASRIDPGRSILEADATGDETLWVARYAFYFSSVSQWPLGDAIKQANEAWDAWGSDPSVTPEEVASSDIACIREENQ